VRDITTTKAGLQPRFIFLFAAIIHLLAVIHENPGLYSTTRFNSPSQLNATKHFVLLRKKRPLGELSLEHESFLSAATLHASPRGAEGFTGARFALCCFVAPLFAGFGGSPWNA